ncbi:MAG: anion permease, partial [Candidatus Pacebacteria bacterium]|nr:anion permease [Candidatus Paceibacterota bacterium]
NVGGVATLVGDPPNIMIGSAARFSFNDFLIHSLPVVVVAWFATLTTLKIVFRKEMKQKPQNVEALMKMNEKDALKDRETLRKILVILGLVVVLFFTHSALHIAPSMVALIGASLALLWVCPKKDPQKVLEKIELSVLLFFASLFVLVGGLEHAGVLEYLANMITGGIEGNLLMTALIVLWSAAILSAIVDNIPLTVAMIPVLTYFTDQGIEINILWWALVFGVGFGGNGSPIGSTANVIVVSKSEQTDNPITFKMWMKSGLSTMFVSLCIGSIALILFTNFFMTGGNHVATQDDVVVTTLNIEK